MLLSQGARVPSIASAAVPRLQHKMHQLNKSGQKMKRAFDPLHDKEATLSLCPCTLASHQQVHAVLKFRV